jgi:hypothetical protein
MKNPTKRSIRSLLVCLVFLAAMFGALSNSGTFTKMAFAQNYGGTEGSSCPDPQICGNFGCHPRSIADPTMVCSRYLLFGAPPVSSCPSPVNCR